MLKSLIALNAPTRPPGMRVRVLGLVVIGSFLVFPAGAEADPAVCLGKAGTIVGTNGDDRLVGTPHADVIVGLAGNDVIFGRGRDDRICGRRGQDELSGGRGDDHLTTGPGNNSVSGDQGRDVLQGGAGGDDNANYIDARRPVYASIKQGFARGQGHDILRPGIDELFGSLRFGDTLIGDKRPQLIAGFGGDDELRGGRREDLLAGGSGNDFIDGGRGQFDFLDDLEFGGPGTGGGVRLDLARGLESGHGQDRLKRVEGTLGSASDDVLRGGPGSDFLIGDEGDDRISGSGGPDLVEGDAGLDQLDGGAGIDYSASFGSPTAVTVDLSRGTLTGADPAKDSDSLAEIEDVLGSAFDDVIVGDDGPNVLRGDPGGDSISGGGGDDILLGDCFGSEDPHLFLDNNFNFDCSSARNPDTLDGGLGTDNCRDGETLVACERSVKSGQRMGAGRALRERRQATPF